MLYTFHGPTHGRRRLEDECTLFQKNTTQEGLVGFRGPATAFTLYSIRAGGDGAHLGLLCHDKQACREETASPAQRSKRAQTMIDRQQRSTLKTPG